MVPTAQKYTSLISNIPVKIEINGTTIKRAMMNKTIIHSTYENGVLTFSFIPFSP
jgi:hypothetical protein